MDEKSWHHSYAPGVLPSLTYDQTTVSQGFSRSAKAFPNRPALNYMGNIISYAALESMVNAFSRVLTAMGIRPGDKVAVCLPNIPQAIIADYAIFRIGAVTVMCNPLYTERELAYQLNDSDSRLIITLTLLVPRIEKIQAQTKIEKIIACHIHSYLPFPKKQLFPYVRKQMYRKITPTENVKIFKDLIRTQSSGPVEDQSRWEDIGALLYTGGTTGVSKGVMLTHANLSANVQQFAAWFPDLKKGTESLVGNFPVFHSAGFTAIQNFCLWQAYEIILVPRPEPAINIEIFKKYKPTFLPGVPTIFVGLLADPNFRKLDFSSIKGFFSGAAPLAADTIRDLKNLTGADMCEVYGSTENSPIVTVTPWGGKIKPGTVGCPVPDTDVKIVDIETGKMEMPMGETGEIIIKGPQIMKGYYKKPEETAKVLKDGWFYSGDIGKFDADGYLTIVDRKKDMIIAGGYNIYPLELDNVLFDHPKILEACVIGVPDTYRGETVKAFIVPKKGENLTEEEVIAYCKKNLAAYKVPKQIEFLEELPKSTVGKILRRELRDRELAKKL
ncbi:MAG: long-chain-fatty-acid--CoA ligase [Desulfobacterales bacterium CG23_combo_of_CG06-09_8_20_14_all_51_8]|nr:MAG: long-chain-fatty-acid--CoA ligase [Desulfobacterales bacterium CG23_combo_of_CG06-09_8_20_14_all_51_8]